MPVMRDKQGTPILDLPFNISNNEFPDIDTNTKFGRTEGLGAVERTLWTGSTNYVFPPEAINMYLTSTHSLDVCTGTIVKAVQVQYLDSSWDTQSEVHSLGGRTPILLNNPVLRVNRMKFLSNCTTHVNTGAIWLGTSDFTAGVPADKYGNIQSGLQQTYQGFYSVARGHKAYMYDMALTVNEGKASKTWIEACNHAEEFDGFPGLKNTYQHKATYDVFEGSLSFQKKIPRKFGEMTDIQFKATGSVGGDVDLSIEYSLMLVGSAYFSNPGR